MAWTAAGERAAGRPAFFLSAPAQAAARRELSHPSRLSRQGPLRGPSRGCSATGSGARRGRRRRLSAVEQQQRGLAAGAARRLPGASLQTLLGRGVRRCEEEVGSVYVGERVCQSVLVGGVRES